MLTVTLGKLATVGLICILLAKLANSETPPFFLLHLTLYRQNLCVAVTIATVFSYVYNLIAELFQCTSSQHTLTPNEHQWKREVFANLI